MLPVLNRQFDGNRVALLCHFVLQCTEEPGSLVRVPWELDTHREVLDLRSIRGLVDSRVPTTLAPRARGLTVMASNIVPLDFPFHAIVPGETAPTPGRLLSS
jgi:hypothetical protein